jgi:hypothetical protein
MSSRDRFAIWGKMIGILSDKFLTQTAIFPCGDHDFETQTNVNMSWCPSTDVCLTHVLILQARGNFRIVTHTLSRITALPLGKLKKQANFCNDYSKDNSIPLFDN